MSLKSAIQKGDVTAVRSRICHDPEMLSWALGLSIEAGSFMVFKYLHSVTDDKIDMQNFFLLACEYGRLKIMCYLVRCGIIDTHYGADQALVIAAKAGKIVVVQYLIKWGADPNAHSGQALQLAAAAGHINMVRFLLKQHVVLHGRNCAIVTACEYGELEVVMYLHRKAGFCSNCENCLIMAAARGQVKILRYFYEYGIQFDLNAICRTACMHGQIRVLKYAQEVGFEIMRDKIVLFKLAALNGKIAVMDYLIGLGLSRENYQVILSDAATQGLVSVFRYFMKRDVAASESFSTSLQLAAENGHYQLVKFLWQNASDLAMLDLSVIHDKRCLRYLTNVLALASDAGLSLLASAVYADRCHPTDLSAIQHLVGHEIDIDKSLGLIYCAIVAKSGDCDHKLSAHELVKWFRAFYACH